MMMDATPLKITGEMTSDPDVCRFHLEEDVVNDWVLIFEAAADGKGSPLVEALFAIDGVRRVQVEGRTVTVAKDHPAPWPTFAKEIGKAIRATCTPGQEPIAPKVIEDLMARPMDEVEGDIRRLLDESINPALASHGGFVRLVEVRDRDLHLEMGGGCQGCASARATLRHGVENAIRKVAPQVRQVVDVTDHAAGTNPYYT